MAKFPAALLSAALAVFGTAQWAVGQNSAPIADQPSMSSDDVLRLTGFLDQVPVAYELNLSDTVFATLQRLQSEQGEKSNGVLEKIAAEAESADELPDPVRRYQREALGKELSGERYKLRIDFGQQRIKLLSSVQFERLRQIDLQHQGAAIFSLPQVVKELSLTAEQQQAIEAIVKDFETKFPNLPARGNPLETARVTSESADVVALVKERGARLEKVLTAEQLAKFAKVRGAEFDLTTLGPGPTLRLEGIAGTRVSLSLARLATHTAIRDELAFSAADHEAILVAWQHWDTTRREKSADHAKSPSLSSIKDTAAGAQLRQKLGRNLWVKGYMRECEAFQTKADRLLTDEQVSRLKQIEWQCKPLEKLLWD